MHINMETLFITIMEQESSTIVVELKKLPNSNRVHTSQNSFHLIQTWIAICYTGGFGISTDSHLEEME